MPGVAPGPESDERLHCPHGQVGGLHVLCMLVWRAPGATVAPSVISLLEGCGSYSRSCRVSMGIKWDCSPCGCRGSEGLSLGQGLGCRPDLSPPPPCPAGCVVWVAWSVENSSCLLFLGMLMTLVRKS